VLPEQVSNAHRGARGKAEPDHPLAHALYSDTFGINSVVKSSQQKLDTGDELRAASDRRPLAFLIETAPNAEHPVLVYCPTEGDWRIAVLAEGRWFDRSTGQELERPTHWMPLQEKQ
jgi:hypothetical protein